MTYNDLTEKVHSNAVKHGFWDERRSNEHCLMLVITEIAEMVEADRKGDKAGVGAKLIMKPCRYYRAFDKFSFTENAFALCKGLSRDVIGIEKRIQFGIAYVNEWAKSLDIDLWWHIMQKMRYNESRPIRHNKAY